MEKFKELIKGEESLWFSICDDEKANFLEYASSIGCSWRDGSKIDPNNDGCGFHMSIRYDYTIAFISHIVWFHIDSKNKKRFTFSEYLKT